MRISLIVAMAANRVIGRQGRLPWRLSADLRRFKRLTTGHALVLGRRTYESIGKVLPGRTNIVLTQQPNYSVPGGAVAASFEQALQLVAGEEELFVAGGEAVYRVALPRADRLYLTLVQAEVSGDRFFPAVDLDDWQMTSEESFAVDEHNQYPHVFRILDRKGNHER